MGARAGAQASFRLWNVRYVVVATKNVTKVPSFFSTVYPTCPPDMSLSACTTDHGDGYSVHRVKGDYGFLEVPAGSEFVICRVRDLPSATMMGLWVVAAPVVMCECGC